MGLRQYGLIVCFWVGRVLAEPVPTEPLTLLTAMELAMSTHNYQGTLAILKNGKLDTLRYYHAVDQGVEQERFSSLNSPLREVVRDNDQVSCLFKASQQTIIDHKPFGQSFLMDLPKTPALLTQNYTLSTEADAEVALQSAVVLVIKPLDQYRYTRKVWVAKQSKLPLKIEVQDFTGETLEQIIFTQLQVVDQIKKISVAKNDKKVQHIHRFESMRLGDFPLQLQNIPAGFEQRSFIRTQLYPSTKTVEQLILSDGLSSVSVYLEKNPQNSHAGLQAAGAVNSLTRVMGEYSITVIGDVPAATVDYISAGVHWAENKAKPD